MGLQDVLEAEGAKGSHCGCGQGQRASSAVMPHPLSWLPGDREDAAEGRHSTKDTPPQSQAGLSPSGTGN